MFCFNLFVIVVTSKSLKCEARCLSVPHVDIVGLKDAIIDAFQVNCIISQSSLIFVAEFVTFEIYASENVLNVFNNFITNNLFELFMRTILSFFVNKDFSFCVLQSKINS